MEYDFDMWTYFLIRRNKQICTTMISLSRHNHIKIKPPHETFYIFCSLFTNTICLFMKYIVTKYN